MISGIGALEFLLIFLVSFVVIGPKDFPKVMFSIGDFIRKLRLASQNFFHQWEEATQFEVSSESEDQGNFRKKQ